jgi:hypothetical protein
MKRHVASVWLLALAVTCASAFAAPMLEFGPSVEFDARTLPFHLSDVRGKAALVVFYQSWCPKCNAWSGEMFQQITKAHGSDRSLVLVAMKTDGGGVRGAVSYLTERKVDVTKWHVASDQGAAYYKAATGATSLFTYVLVGPTGDIQDSGKAGMFYTGGGPRRFVLASTNLLKEAKGAQPFLPADREYPDALAMAVKAAEVGNLSLARKLGKKYAAKASLREAASEFLSDIVTSAGRQVDDCRAKLEGEDADKYGVYLTVRRIAGHLGDTKPGQDAKAMADKLRGDPAVRNEAAAEKAYRTLMAKAAKLKPEVRDRALAKALSQLAAKYPDTRYGRLAGQ